MKRRLGLESLEERTVLSVGATGQVGQYIALGGLVAAPLGSVLFTPNETPAQIQFAVSATPNGAKFYFEPGTYYDVSITPRDYDSFFGADDSVLQGVKAKAAFDSYSGGGGDNVTLFNLLITGYQAEQPTGYGTITWGSPPYAAVDTGRNWIINHVTVTNSASCGIQVSDGSVLENSLMANNGQEGGRAEQVTQYEGNNTPIMVRNNLIENNNTAGVFSPSFGAGGFKTYDTNNVTFDHNTVLNNNGEGVWFDTNCNNTVIRNNLVQRNAWTGIDLEISGATTVTGNMILNNAFASNPIWPPAGIQMQDQSNTLISGNTLSGNGNTIIMFSSLRSDLNINWTLTNVQFVGNTIIASQGIVAGIASASDTGSDPYAPGNVVFKGNTYHVSGTAGFIFKQWLAIDETLAQWEAAGQS